MKMKNKQAQQIAARKNHKQLKQKRRSEPTLKREENTLIEKPTILIVCEGENTEPSYFQQFKLSSATIEPIGEGYSTVSLVKRAIKLSKERDYDQVWCVFDADPKPDNPEQRKNFNQAIKLAQENDLKVAYSNQAFEYWIILHFDDHQGGKMDRGDYNYKINMCLKPHKIKYDGNGGKFITEEIFELLDGIDNKTGNERKQMAIKRAKRNYNQFDHTNPSIEESTTTVFKLVEELLKHL